MLEGDLPDGGLTHSLTLVGVLGLLGLEVINGETSDTTRHGGGGHNPLLGLLEYILLRHPTKRFDASARVQCRLGTIKQASNKGARGGQKSEACTRHTTQQVRWRPALAVENKRCTGSGESRGGTENDYTDLGTLLAQTAVEESPVQLTGVTLHVKACLALAVNETERLQ